jgi:branched-subunit amino acid ABC-type transport system permease component
MQHTAESVAGQLLTNGLITYSAVLCISIAFLCCFLVFKFYDFSLPACCCIGAYLASQLAGHGVPFFAAVFLGATGAGLTNLALANFLYGPLADQRVTSSGLILSSLAVYTVVLNSISMFYGAGIRIMEVPSAEALRFPGGFPFSSAQLLLVICAGVSALAYASVMTRTTFGTRVQAFYQNSELAAIVGIEGRSLRLSMYFAGGGIAGFAGALLGADSGLTPSVGFSVYLMAVVSVILAGPLAKGAILATSALVAILSHVTIWFFGADFLNAIVFTALLVVLTFRAYRPVVQRTT